MSNTKDNQGKDKQPVDPNGEPIVRPNAPSGSALSAKADTIVKGEPIVRPDGEPIVRP